MVINRHPFISISTLEKSFYVFILIFCTTLLHILAENPYPAILFYMISRYRTLIRQKQDYEIQYQSG